MKPSNAADGQRALATLRRFREQLDLTSLSDEDRAAMARSWATIYGPRPTTVPLGAPLMAMVMPLFDPSDLDLDPRLIPATLGLRAFAHAIELGLPGAEREAEGFLRDCGFEESESREILQQMLSKAPEPKSGDLN